MNSNSLYKHILSNTNANNDIVTNIVSHFEKRDFKTNEFLLKEGELSNEYFFLSSGFIRSYTHDLDNNEVTTNFYTQNQFVFEAASFFTQSISQENIQALTDSTVYIITFEKLNKLFHTIPEFREFGRSILVKNLVTLKQRTLSLINETAEVRYKKLLNSNKEIFQHAQLKQIASYLGVTDTSLSRIRKETLKR